MVEELHFHAHGYGETVAFPNRKKSNVYRLPDRTKYLREDMPRADNFEPETIQLFREAYRSMQIPGIEREQTLKDDHLLDMIIVTVIASCQNVKVLRLDVDFLHQNTFLPKALGHLLNTDSGSMPTTHGAFTKLTSVQLDPTNVIWNSNGKDRIEYPLTSYLPFFYLPSLETFSAPLSDRRDIHKKRASDQSPRKWPASPPPVFTLRTLKLCRTLADPVTLTFLLAQTPYLESLTYDFHRNGTMLFDCVQLRCALHSVAATLRSLTISYEVFATEAYEYTDMSEYLVNHQGLGSLHFLSHLTNLEIALPILLGWKDTAGLRLAAALPASLDTFCLRDDCMDYMNNVWWEEVTIEEVRHWMEQKSTTPGSCTPHLQRFGFRMCESEGEQWNKHHHQILMDICKAAGVQWWSERQRDLDGGWDDVDHPERAQDKIMGWAGYVYPEGEMGSRVKRALQDSVETETFSEDS
ncbi:hypothetical protein P171DRAFT_491184 [Karstenula rhodostoma CBS 690.94]|uniref:Uncharacterized protein n=1 Tax=Karstenula rhodostoma CBS 690.94 TaxID=1392251 RepID=A0A9P4P533_9PLEO|nr:hypothetical protein P171DRAFT_491184 [Karstenula rhodostoma CBS 690.94]